jgi:hypothetical protein
MPAGNSCCPDGLHNCPSPYACDSNNQCVGGGGSGGSGGCTAKYCCGGLYECNGQCYSTCVPGSQPCCTETQCTCYTPCC